MKRSLFLLFLAGLCIGWLVVPVAAQDVPAEDAEATAADSEDFEPNLKYDDYTVKAYTLSFFGGGFSGTTYLENQELWPRTVLTEGANDIVAYSGDVLQVSRDVNHYDAAHKKIEPGNVFGARVGIYIADNFHLDLVGSYATGKAVTSMLYTPDPDREPDNKYPRRGRRGQRFQGLQWRREPGLRRAVRPDVRCHPPPGLRARRRHQPLQ